MAAGEGLHSFAKDISHVGTELLPVARVIVQKTSADIKRDGQARAAVDTGYMRGSITYETRELASSVVGEIGPTASYARFVEEGTSQHAPQPFMGPAAQTHFPLFEAALDQAIARLL